MALASDKVKQKPSNYYNKKDTVIKYDAFCLILSVFINFKFYCFLNGSTPSTPSILTSHSVVLLNVRFRVAFCPCK